MLPRINTSLLKILFVVLLIGRFLLDFFGNWREGECLPYSFSLPADRPWAKSVIPDDREIGRSAYFYIHDHKYLIDVSNDRPKFRKEAIWPSAFRNRYHILYEVFLIKVHERFYGPVVIEADHNLSLSYLSLYAEVLFFLKWLSKLLAVYFLYKGARLFFSSGVSLLFLIAWELYPSNFYILHLTALDNIVVHICIIIVGLSLLLAVEKKPDYKKVIALGLFSCLGFTLKFHVLAITFSICLFAMLYGLLKKNYTLVFSFLAVILICLCIVFPLLRSTKNTIGHSVLSTQSAINFFHGHNPVARGSWSSLIWSTYPEILNPMLEKEKQNLSKDEYTETEVYKKLAYQWMIGHPKEEVILSIKKVLIYFTPFNFLSWRVNLFTLLVHLGFIGLTIWMVFQPLRFDIAYWILIVAPWAMVALSVLYFVEYRWRYYVEAPMLLSAFIFFRLVYDRIMGTDQRAAAVI